VRVLLVDPAYPDASWGLNHLVSLRPRLQFAAFATLAALAASAGIASEAASTWSLAAVDPHSQEVGVAGASCYRDTERIARVVPGRGAVAAQAYSNIEGRDRAVELLAGGTRPQDVVREIANASFDSFYLPIFHFRQYGVAALGPEVSAAAFTGRLNVGWRGDLQGLGISVQGNLLRGPEVLESALHAYEQIAGVACATLADRLLAGLEAGARSGGDRRCSLEQTALSAVLVVARPDDEYEHPTLHIAVQTQAKDGPNPVVLLRQRYDVWRATSGAVACDLLQR
jgi:uncharacterized Ntn-hydrolase superfamily protein